MFFLCTLPPSKQWNIRSLPQIPQTHPEEAMWKGSIKLRQIHKPSSCKLQSDTKPCHSWNTIFLVYGRDRNLPLHHLLEPIQQFLGDPEFGLLNLEAHCLALVIAKKTLDENHFRTVQKTTDREPPSFKMGNRVYFRNKQPGKWDLKWRPGYQIVMYWTQWTLPSYWKSGYWKNKIMQHQRCSTQTTSRTMEYQHSIWQSRKIHQPSCKIPNYYTHRLKMKNSTHVHRHL